MADPDETMTARAAAEWRTATTSKLYRKRNMLATQQAPDGICKPCWQNLGCYGLKIWASDPLEVLRIDLAAADQASRTMLAKELVALADLWAAHQAEFRKHLTSEEILAALTKMSM